MITIEGLKEFGADVQTGLARCLGKQEFYLKMIAIGMGDERFEKLGSVLEEKNLDFAFELCHALKGVSGNLALTPMYEILAKMTESLRSRQDVDYSEMYAQIMERRKKLLEM